MLIIFVVFLCVMSASSGVPCEDKDLGYQFTECINNERKVVFFWNNPDCTSLPPAPLEHVSCETICEPGNYLGYSHALRNFTCEKCPLNTYSTGNTLRISNEDFNWDDLPKGASMHCIWTKGRYWNTAPCDSFVSKKDGSALIINKEILRPDTWNILEFKLTVYLIQEGTIKFTYKKASKRVDNYINGRFRFFIGFYSYLHDSDTTKTAPQTAAFQLPKGYNELTWRFALNTRTNIRDVFVELSDIEITYATQTPLSCKPCKVGSSLVGSSKCSHCSANSVFDPILSQCKNCTAEKMAYPGDSTCKPRPECVVGYDFIPVFTKCIDNKRDLYYTWREGSVCNRGGSVAPQRENELPCKPCRPGTYTVLAPEKVCFKCKDGKFSTTENANKCEVCQAGYYASKIVSYEGLEELPEEVETRCEKMDNAVVNPCDTYKGWVVINGSFALPPFLPVGTRLTLRTTVNITAKRGKLDFTYRIADKTEALRLVIDGVATELDAADSNKLISFFTFPGVHTVEWIYEKVASEEVQTRGVIHFIRIEGTGKGSADSCVKCAKGTFSEASSTECTPCPPGTTSNTNNTQCESCPEGFYKTSTMAICEKCPMHTRATPNKTACELYDAYDLNGEYLFNLLKFDPIRKWSLRELKDHRKSGSFFGPFTDSAESIIYFFSPKVALKLDTDSYEYEDDLSGYQEGHVFGLVLIQDDNSVSRISPEHGKMHYRIKRNFGSRLTSVNWGNWSKGELVFEYGDGDICQGDTRYSSQITFICDKSISSASRLEMTNTDADKCTKEFVWRSPYACSECKYNDTMKYLGSCNSGRRNVYLDEGDKCIVHNAESALLTIEEVELNETTVTTKDASDHFEQGERVRYKDFVYTDEFVENCNELELSVYIAIALGVVLVLIIATAVVAIIVTLNYKKKCYELLDSKAIQKESKDESTFLPIDHPQNRIA